MLFRSTEYLPELRGCVQARPLCYYYQKKVYTIFDLMYLWKNIISSKLVDHFSLLCTSLTAYPVLLSEKYHLFCFNDILVYVLKADVKKTKDVTKSDTNMHFNLVWLTDGPDANDLTITCPNRSLSLPSLEYRGLLPLNTHSHFSSLTLFPLVANMQEAGGPFWQRGR